MVTITNELSTVCKYTVLSKFMPKTPVRYAPNPIAQANTANEVLAMRSSFREVSNRSDTNSSEDEI